MTLRKLAGVAVMTVALAGCDKIPAWVPFIGNKEPPPAAPVARAPAPAADTTPAAPPANAPPPLKVAVDEAWTPLDTGTVTPGMTREQVISLWGVPVAERANDQAVYLYFRNGCEATCGTFDLVVLEGGQVVDAVVRGPGHTYTGESSSPAGKKPEATPRSAGP